MDDLRITSGSPNTLLHRGDEAGEPVHWYALHTRSRHEKKVRDRLLERNVETFLPLCERWNRWKDRTKRVEIARRLAQQLDPLEPPTAGRGVVDIDEIVETRALRGVHILPRARSVAPYHVCITGSCARAAAHSASSPSAAPTALRSPRTP